jgi:hypothetical protein
MRYLTPELLNQEQSRRVEAQGVLPVELRRIKDEIEKGLRNCRGGFCYGNGELKLCGSMGEGTKVFQMDEYDYQYLINVDGLHPEQKTLIRTKPPISNQVSLSYFKLIVPDALGRPSELKAFHIQDDFYDVVRKAVAPLPYKDLEVRKAGPAVKVSYLDSSNNRMKIDLTLGLKTDPSQLANLSEFAIELLGRNTTLPGVELKAHFVAAHDYWKLCFVETEQDVMKHIIESDPIKGAVYRIIKVWFCMVMFVLCVSLEELIPPRCQLGPPMFI